MAERGESTVYLYCLLIDQNPYELAEVTLDTAVCAKQYQAFETRFSSRNIIHPFLLNLLIMKTYKSHSY